MLDLAVDAVAAYRLTRLVTKDVITRKARASVIEWAYRDTPRPMTLDMDHSDTVIIYDDPKPVASMTVDDWEQLAWTDEHPPMLVEFIHCRWCVGIWIGAGVIAARRLAPRAWEPVARALVCGSAAALLARLETD